MNSLIAVSELAKRLDRSPRYVLGRAALAGVGVAAVEIGGGRVVSAVPAEDAERLAQLLAAEAARLGVVTAPAGMIPAAVQ